MDGWREGQQSIKGAAARLDHLSCLDALRKYECESERRSPPSLSLSHSVHTHTPSCVENSDTWSALLQQLAAQTNSAHTHIGPGAHAFVFPSSAPRILITSKHNDRLPACTIYIYTRSLTHPGGRSKSNNARERPVVKDVCDE